MSPQQNSHCSVRRVCVADDTWSRKLQSAEFSNIQNRSSISRLELHHRDFQGNLLSSVYRYQLCIDLCNRSDLLIRSTTRSTIRGSGLALAIPMMNYLHVFRYTYSEWSSKERLGIPVFCSWCRDQLSKYTLSGVILAILQCLLSYSSPAITVPRLQFSANIERWKGNILCRS